MLFVCFVCGMEKERGKVRGVLKGFCSWHRPWSILPGVTGTRPLSGERGGGPTSWLGKRSSHDERRDNFVLAQPERVGLFYLLWAAELIVNQTAWFQA